LRERPVLRLERPRLQGRRQARRVLHVGLLHRGDRVHHGQLVHRRIPGVVRRVPGQTVGSL